MNGRRVKSLILMGYVNGNGSREINFVQKDQVMVRLEDLPEIVSGRMAADVIGKSVWWLQRRRHIPIYAPTSSGKYPRRQVELIVEVESGVCTAEHAYLTLQAEYDAKRAKNAIAIAKSLKRRK